MPGLIRFFIVLCLLVPPPLAAAQGVPEVADFAELGRQARQREQVILVMFAATYCEYCERLEAEQLQPLRLGGEFAGQVLIRKHVVDRVGFIRDFSGQQVGYSDFADRYDIDITPTIVFFDGQGRPVGRRLFGYNGSDFFAVRLEQAIARAYALIHKQP